MKPYSHLQTLVIGYFGQDFDLAGDCRDSILKTYLQDESPAVQAALRAEIVDFMQTYANLDAEFERRYQPDWDAERFGPTVRDFLEAVLAALPKVPT